MTDVTQETFCNNGHRMAESPNLPAGERTPCPQCGSLARRFHVGMEDAAVTIHSNLSVKARSPGKRAFMEQKVGDSFSIARQKWMQLQQVVDRRANRYIKKVVDPETGEVLRDVDERLTDHQGYGDAPRKRS